MAMAGNAEGADGAMREGFPPEQQPPRHVLVPLVQRGDNVEGPPPAAVGRPDGAAVPSSSPRASPRTRVVTVSINPSGADAGAPHHGQLAQQQQQQQQQQHLLHQLPPSVGEGDERGISHAGVMQGSLFKPIQRIRIIEDPDIYRPSTPILNWEGPRRSLKPPKLQIWLVITVLMTLQMIACALVPHYHPNAATTFLSLWIPASALFTGTMLFMSTTRHLHELTVLMQSINTPVDMDKVVERLQKGRFSRFEEPWKVQVHIIKMFCRLLKFHHGVHPVTGTFITSAGGGDATSFSDESGSWGAGDAQPGQRAAAVASGEPTQQSVRSFESALAHHAAQQMGVAATPDMDQASMHTAEESLTDVFHASSHSPPPDGDATAGEAFLSPPPPPAAAAAVTGGGVLPNASGDGSGSRRGNSPMSFHHRPMSPCSPTSPNRPWRDRAPGNRHRRDSGAAARHSTLHEADPLDDNNRSWAEVLGSDDPPSGSLILSLLSQLKLGQDLSRVAFPIHVLESRSMLEKIGDLFTHPDIFGGIAAASDPVERLVAVTRWYISGFHMRPKGAKKPYNPILGETFECFFARGTPHEVHYVAEQVSHHPPISVFCALHVATGTRVTGNYHPTSKLVSPNSVSSEGCGQLVLDVPTQAASYHMNWPSVHVLGLLRGPMRIEVIGSVEIRPEGSELVSRLEFKPKPMFGGQYDELRGGIARGKAKLFSFEGKWHSRITYAPLPPPGAPKGTAIGPPSVLFDSAHHEALRPFAPATSFPKPSRVVWKNVTVALRANEARAAQMAKEEVEMRERELRRSREARNEHYKPGFFRVARGEGVTDLKSFWTYVGKAPL